MTSPLGGRARQRGLHAHHVARDGRDLVHAQRPARGLVDQPLPDREAAPVPRRDGHVGARHAHHRGARRGRELPAQRRAPQKLVRERRGVGKRHRARRRVEPPARGLHVHREGHGAPGLHPLHRRLVRAARGERVLPRDHLLRLARERPRRVRAVEQGLHVRRRGPERRLDADPHDAVVLVDVLPGHLVLTSPAPRGTANP